MIELSQLRRVHPIKHWKDKRGREITIPYRGEVMIDTHRLSTHLLRQVFGEEWTRRVRISRDGEIAIWEYRHLDGKLIKLYITKQGEIYTDDMETPLRKLENYAFSTMMILVRLGVVMPKVLMENLVS